MENQESPVLPVVPTPEPLPVSAPQPTPVIDPFAAAAPPPTAAPQTAEVSVKKSSPLLWSIVGVVALLVIGGMVYILLRMPKTAGRTATQVAPPTFSSKNLFTIQLTNN